MSQTKSVLLVAENFIARAGLRKIIQNSDEFEMAAEVTRGKTALRRCQTCPPDLIVLDLAVTKKEGFAFLLEIKRRWPTIKMVALNTHCDRGLPNKALQAVVDGYYHLDTGSEDLLQVIHEVCGRARPSPWRNGRCCTSLTRREKEIIHLVAQGHTNRQIAKILNVSDLTVDSHCTNIRTKLKLNSKRAIAAYAFRSGLVQ